ncbi:hypothetical protein CSUI_000506 [Cystoisospora suis]|uniref:Uncharacterized protein n=1 Tax=Cystoisospora suis TaxID=483139 RepID=A0A2C6LFY9_9APIC|nr:hypothetical protein CSUI_000506 [Cystoisospora suis]
MLTATRGNRGDLLLSTPSPWLPDCFPPGASSITAQVDAVEAFIRSRYGASQKSQPRQGTCCLRAGETLIGHPGAGVSTGVRCQQGASDAERVVSSAEVVLQNGEERTNEGREKKDVEKGEMSKGALRGESQSSRERSSRCISEGECGIEILHTLLFSIATGDLRIVDWKPEHRWRLVESLFLPPDISIDRKGQKKEEEEQQQQLPLGDLILETTTGDSNSVQGTESSRIPADEEQLHAGNAKSSDLVDGDKERSDQSTERKRRSALGPAFSSQIIFQAFDSFLNQWLLYAEDAVNGSSCSRFLTKLHKGEEKEDLYPSDWPSSWHQWSFIIRLLQRFFQRRYLRSLFLSPRCVSERKSSSSPCPSRLLSSSGRSPLYSGFISSSQRGSLMPLSLDLVMQHLLGFPALLEEAVSYLPGGGVASRTLIPTSLSFPYIEHEVAGCLLTLWSCTSILRRRKEEGKTHRKDWRREEKAVSSTAHEGARASVFVRGIDGTCQETQHGEDNSVHKDEGTGREGKERKRKGRDSEWKFLLEEHEMLDDHPFSLESMREATRRFVMRGHVTALARVVVLSLLPSSQTKKKAGGGRTEQATLGLLATVRCLAEELRRAEVRGPAVLTFITACLRELSPFFFLSSPNAYLCRVADDSSSSRILLEPVCSEPHNSTNAPWSRVVSRLRHSTNCLSAHSVSALHLLRTLLLSCIPIVDCHGSPSPLTAAGSSSVQVSLPQVDELFQVLLKMVDPRSPRCLPLPPALAVIDLLGGDELLAWIPTDRRSADLSGIKTCDRDSCGRPTESPGTPKKPLETSLTGDHEGQSFSSPSGGLALMLTFVDFSDHLLQLWETAETLREVSLHQHVALTVMLLRCLSAVCRLEGRVLQNYQREELCSGPTNPTRTCTPGCSASCDGSHGGSNAYDPRIWGEKLVFSVLTPEMIEIVRRRFIFKGIAREQRLRRLMEGVHLRLGSSEEIVRCCGMAVAEDLAHLLVVSLTGAEETTANGRAPASHRASHSGFENAGSAKDGSRQKGRRTVDGLRFSELREPQLEGRHPIFVKYLRAVKCEGWLIARRLGLHSVALEAERKTNWRSDSNNNQENTHVTGNSEKKEGRPSERSDTSGARAEPSAESETEVEELLVVPETQDDVGHLEQLHQFLNPPRVAEKAWMCAVSTVAEETAALEVATSDKKPLGDEVKEDTMSSPTSKATSSPIQLSSKANGDVSPAGHKSAPSSITCFSPDVKRSIRVAVTGDDEEESSDEDNAYFESLPDLAPMQPLSGPCRESQMETSAYEQPSGQPDSRLLPPCGPAESLAPRLLPQPPPGAPGLPQSVRQVAEWLTGTMHVVDESPETYGQLDPASSAARGNAAGGNEPPAHRMFRISAALHTCAPLLLLQFYSALKTRNRSRPEVRLPPECPGEFSDPYLGPRLLRALLTTETAHGTGLEIIRRESLAALLAVQLSSLLPLLCEILTSTDYVVGQRLVLLEALQKAMAWLADGAPKDWTCLRGVEEQDQETDADEDAEDSDDSVGHEEDLLSSLKESPDDPECFLGREEGEVNHENPGGTPQRRGSYSRVHRMHPSEERDTGAVAGEEAAGAVFWNHAEDRLRWRGGRTRRFAHPTQAVRTTVNYLVPHAERVCVQLLAVLELPSFPASADFLTQQRHRQRLAAHRQALSQPLLVASILHTVGVCIQHTGQGLLNAGELYGLAIRTAHRFKGHADRHVRRAALGLLAAIGAMPGVRVSSLVSWIEDAEVGCIYTPGWELESQGEGGFPGGRRTPGGSVFFPECQKYTVGVRRGGATAIVQWLQAQMQSDPDEVCRQLSGLVLSMWLELPSS